MFDVDEFVARCRTALAEGDATAAIKEEMQRAVSLGRDLTQALGEPGVSDINVLYKGDDLTVVNAVWAPCLTLYPHNHNMTALIAIYGGAEDNVFWRRHPKGLEKAGGRELRERDVAVLGPSIIHSVSNPSGAYTGALHVYMGDLLAAPRSEWDPVTFEERPYDLEHRDHVFAVADAAWKQAPASR